MATATTKTEWKASRVKDASKWRDAGKHDVVLASGVEVTIKIPNLPQMVKTGQIPNDLLDAALGAIQKQEITPELIKEQADFYHLMVATMVVEPQVTETEIPELPYEDIELLVELGTRQRDVDAIGQQISGLHLSADWRKFRGWDSGDEDVAGR